MHHSSPNFISSSKGHNHITVHFWCCSFLCYAFSPNGHQLIISCIFYISVCPMLLISLILTLITVKMQFLWVEKAQCLAQDLVSNTYNCTISCSCTNVGFEPTSFDSLVEVLRAYTRLKPTYPCMVTHCSTFELISLEKQ